MSRILDEKASYLFDTRMKDRVSGNYQNLYNQLQIEWHRYYYFIRSIKREEISEENFGLHENY
jgi:hypothetical protein